MNACIIATYCRSHDDDKMYINTVTLVIGRAYLVVRSCRACAKLGVVVLTTEGAGARRTVLTATGTDGVLSKYITGRAG